MLIDSWRIAFCWYWRNAWVGLRYSTNKRALYINLVPFLSLRISFGCKEMFPPEFHEMPTPRIIQPSDIEDLADIWEQEHRVPENLKGFKSASNADIAQANADAKTRRYRGE